MTYACRRKRWLSSSMRTLGFLSSLVISPALAQVPSTSENWFWPSDPQDDPGGTRGGLCSIVPGRWATGGIAQAILGDQPPIFLWDALPGQTVQQIQILGPDRSEVWTHAVTPTEQSQESVLYTGPALSPGLTYRYIITYQSADMPTPSPDTLILEVLTAEERGDIQSELAVLNEQIHDLSLEAQALARAQYFRSQDLGLEALRELYSVTDPSPELRDRLQADRDRICDPN